MEWNVEACFHALVSQHRNEEALGLVEALLRQNPIPLDVIPIILRLLSEKDLNLYKEKTRVDFYLLASLLEKYSPVVGGPYQLLIHLYSNDVYNLPLLNVLDSFEAQLSKLKELEFPLIYMYSGLLNFQRWEEMIRRLRLTDRDLYDFAYHRNRQLYNRRRGHNASRYDLITDIFDRMENPMVELKKNPNIRLPMDEETKKKYEEIRKREEIEEKEEEEMERKWFLSIMNPNSVPTENEDYHLDLPEEFEEEYDEDDAVDEEQLQLAIIKENTSLDVQSQSDEEIEFGQSIEPIITLPSPIIAGFHPTIMTRNKSRFLNGGGDSNNNVIGPLSLNGDKEEEDKSEKKQIIKKKSSTSTTSTTSTSSSTSTTPLFGAVKSKPTTSSSSTSTTSSSRNKNYSKAKEDIIQTTAYPSGDDSVPKPTGNRNYSKAKENIIQTTAHPSEGEQEKKPIISYKEDEEKPKKKLIKKRKAEVEDEEEEQLNGIKTPFIENELTSERYLRKVPRTKKEEPMDPVKKAKKIKKKERKRERREKFQKETLENHPFEPKEFTTRGKTPVDYFSRAYHRLQRAFHRNPTFDFLVLPLVKMAMYRNKLKVADNILRYFVTHNPSNPNSYLLYGSFLREHFNVSRRYDIIQCITQLLKLDPVSNMGFFMLSEEFKHPLSSNIIIDQFVEILIGRLSYTPYDPYIWSIAAKSISKYYSKSDKNEYKSLPKASKLFIKNLYDPTSDSLIQDINCLIDKIITLYYFNPHSSQQYFHQLLKFKMKEKEFLEKLVKRFDRHSIDLSVLAQKDTDVYQLLTKYHNSYLQEKKDIQTKRRAPKKK